MSEKKLRILLAEGGSGEGAAALRALYPEEQDRLELTVVAAIPTLIPTLEIVQPEVIFLDLSIGHPDPLDAVRLVHRTAPAVPLIVFADPVEKDCAAQSLSQGALDYLLKGFMDSRTLERVLRAALEYNTLDGLANFLRDPVTGLYIRDGFLTLGSRAMEVAKRNNSTLVLLCMHLEDLLPLGAEYGASAVESSLRDVAKLLAGSFRRTDLVGRIGESQFAALAIDAIEPSAPVLCQRLETRIAVLNHDRGPWGPLKLRMNARFWSAKDTSGFAEYLDTVEAGLRIPPVQVADQPGSCGTEIATEER